MRVLMGNKYVSKAEYLARTKRERSRKKMPRLANKQARAGLAKLVKKIVRRQEETKYVSQYVQLPDGSSILRWNAITGSIPTFTSAINSTTELYAAIPQVAQGVGSFQRIGDKISPVRCRLDLMAFIGDYNIGNTFDITVHVFVVSCKAVKFLLNTSAIPINTLLNQGDGTDVGFDGTLQNTQLPANTHEFTVHSHQAIHMNKADGYTNGALDSMGTPNRDTQGGALGLYRRSITVPLPKVLTYNQDADLYPVNAAPVLCVGWVRNDSEGHNAPSSTRYVSLCARTHMWFKDS